MRPGAAPAGPGAQAFRRLRRDRWALAWGALFLLLLVAFLAALYASAVGTGPSDNHLTDQITVAGEREYIVSVEGIPIGPTWHVGVPARRRRERARPDGAAAPTAAGRRC